MNINSIRNKFELLSHQVTGNIDALLVSETKIDDSFQVRNFLIHDFSPPDWLDSDSKSGGRIMLYMREDIPSNHVTTDKQPIESLYVELKLRNENYMINCS